MEIARFGCVRLNFARNVDVPFQALDWWLYSAFDFILVNTSYFYVSPQWKSLKLFSFPFSEVLLTALPLICVIFVSAESIEHQTLRRESGWFYISFGVSKANKRSLAIPYPRPA